MGFNSAFKGLNRLLGEAWRQILYSKQLFAYLVANIAGGKEADGVWEQGVEANI